MYCNTLINNDKAYCNTKLIFKFEMENYESSRLPLSPDVLFSFPRINYEVIGGNWITQSIIPG